MKDRKQHVVLTAKRLFLEKGFTHTSVQDIIEESNISKGTFYNYFSSKNDCITAILQLAKDEEFMRRHELITGEDRSNKDIFIKQILLSFQINQEYNLLPIFESIFHSSDLDLRTFVNGLYIKELSWIKQRFIDIYGPEAKPYAADCAILFYGMVKQLIHTWKSRKEEVINHSKLIEFTLNRMDAIINNLIESKETLFKDSLLLKVNDSSSKNQIVLSKKGVIDQLTYFEDAVHRSKLLSSDTAEYIHFLLEELNRELPRASIIKTVMPSFRKAFEHSPFKKRALELSITIWRFIDD